ncbi:MAG: hypothetical protein JSW59_04815 [Phycisphaerales bacterium]|nr:MAG: hypothetical protein JSW59_04815 [Phycisphaerales bacterium]
MIQMNARKTSTIVIGLTTAVLAIAEPPASATEAASKERLRRTELQNRKADAERPTNPQDTQAREPFLEIERIARLPRDEQISQLPRLYRDLAPRYMSPFITGIISSYRSNILEHGSSGGPGGDHFSRWSGQLSEAAKKLTPEVVADKIGSRMWLRVAARVRCLQVFKDHPTRMMELIDSDLDSGKADRVGRAASTILALELRSYSKRLLDMFLAESADPQVRDTSNRAISKPVRRTLLFMHDPAIIPVLLEKVKQNPRVLIHVSGLFQHNLYGKPVNPMLFNLISSQDREVKYHAAYALAECKDAKLTPVAAEFAADRESRFRWLGGHWSASLPRESFLSIRSDLMPLLKDKEQDVFKQALRCFARHKDPEAGKIILDLLKKNEISSQLKVTVMQCFSEMAGSNFGYYMHKWGPGYGRNSEAIEKFENWLKDLGKNGSS